MSTSTAPRRLGPPGLIAKKVARRLTRREREGIIEPPLPPACPAGWRTGAPDFVGIGAQRAGTTRWFRLLEAHPAIHPAPASKELHYFDRYYVGGFGEREALAYGSHFPRPEGAIAGEWTPGYLPSPWVPSLLAQAAPRAKLLVLLRDPVERYLSGLKHDEWVAEQARLPLSQHAPIEAFARGFYHAQLSAWLEHFDRSQVLILQFERCGAEPGPQLSRTLEFLGVGEQGFEPDIDHHPNLQGGKPSLAPEVRDSYARAYRDDVLRLAADFPEIDLELWPSFAELA